MAVLLDLFPSFYLDGKAFSLTQSELESIIPRKLHPAVSLLLPDIIDEEIPPKSEEQEASRHGFHPGMQVSHQLPSLKHKSIDIRGVFKDAFSTYSDNLIIKDGYRGQAAVSQLQESSDREQAAEDRLQESSGYCGQAAVRGLQKSAVTSEHDDKTESVLVLNNAKKILHPSILNNHYKIAYQLLKDGYSDPHHIIKAKSKNIFSLMIEDLSDKMTEYAHNPQSHVMKEIDDLIATIKLFSEHCGNICYTADHNTTNASQTTNSPVSLIMKVLASLAPTKEILNKLNELATFVSTIDSSEAIFTNAKNLLHMFPTGKIYPLKVSDSETILFQSESSFGLITTELVKKSLTAFSDKLGCEQIDTLKSAVFDSLKSIYSNAVDFSEKRLLEETAEKSVKLFQDDKTVLLPTGWEGHLIDIAVSKPQSLFLFANSGEQDDTAFSGDTFRSLEDPAKIEADFFYDVLANSNNQFLSNGLLSKYSISEAIDWIDRDSQKFNNCALETHRDAVEGLIFIELQNHHIDSLQSKALAKTYYQEWDRFLGDYIIDTYMSHKPGLPAQALIDIYKELLKDPMDETKQHYTQKIEELLSSQYQDEYKDWLQSMDTTIDSSSQEMEQAPPTFQSNENHLHETSSQAIETPCSFMSSPQAEPLVHMPEPALVW